MLYPRDHRAADILLGPRPSQKKKRTIEAANIHSRRLVIAAHAITMNRGLMIELFTPRPVDGKKKHKRFKALLHIRSHHDATMMTLRRIFEDLKFLNKQ